MGWEQINNICLMKHLIRLIELQKYSRTHLFGFNDLGLVKPEINSVGLFVELNSHSFLLASRSKNAAAMTRG